MADDMMPVVGYRQKDPRTGDWSQIDAEEEMEVDQVYTCPAEQVVKRVRTRLKGPACVSAIRCFSAGQAVT
jgi:hypothetical protein